MQLVTFREGTATRAGLLDAGRVRPLPFASVDDALRGSALQELHGLAEPRAGAPDLAAVELAPLVVRPGKVVCVGQNYAGHIAEMGRTPPTHPTLFAKFASTLTGAHDDIELHEPSTQWDWEAELAIVIGRSILRASATEARAAIAGFTVLNDVTARDWQKRTAQWLQGKNFDGTTPLGPALVTADEVGDGSGLRISCSIDDEVVQDSSTSDLVFGPVDVVAYVSQAMSLQPGDVIATGTPAGVGTGRTPPRFLQHGEVLTTRIDGLGECRNRCLRPVAAHPADGE